MPADVGIWKETELPPDPYARKTTLAWTAGNFLTVVPIMGILPPLLYHSEALNKLFILLVILSPVYRGGVYYIKTTIKTDINM